MGLCRKPFKQKKRWFQTGTFRLRSVCVPHTFLLPNSKVCFISIRSYTFRSTVAQILKKNSPSPYVPIRSVQPLHENLNYVYVPIRSGCVPVTFLRAFHKEALLSHAFLYVPCGGATKQLWLLFERGRALYCKGPPQPSSGGALSGGNDTFRIRSGYVPYTFRTGHRFWILDGGPCARRPLFNFKLWVEHYRCMTLLMEVIKPHLDPEPPMESSIAEFL